jgi:hypothetical protein
VAQSSGSDHNRKGLNKMTPQKTARIAGLLYFFFLILGIFSFFYVPSQIFVEGDASATARNIVTNQLLFRFGIVSNLIGQITFLFLVLLLYQLFEKVNKMYARLMVALVIASVPITFIVILNQLASLALLSEADFLKSLSQSQLHTLSLLFYNFYNDGIIVVGLFWGLWLYPFGYLVIKSKFLPKILGILLLIGCFCYLIDSLSFLLLPNYRNMISSILTLPTAIGEVSMIFWLLIKGVKVKENKLYE